MTETLKRHKAWLLPLILLAAITPFTPYLDREIERHFHEMATPPEQFHNTSVLQFFYVFGLVPGQLTGILSLIALILSFLLPSCRSLRRHALFIALTLAVGSGLIVHVILKDHWGRPRPRQVIEFGGKQEFRPYWSPNFFHQPEPSKSFPCGHCSLGFYFFVFILLGQRFKVRWLFYLGILLTAFLGLALSYTRMAQGGHFFSDVLVSALIMWLTALAFDRLIYGDSA